MDPIIKNTQVHSASAANRKPGRPKAIPQGLIPKILCLYDEGLGYRAIARELRREGLSVDWSTVRRLVKTPIVGKETEERA